MKENAMSEPMLSNKPWRRRPPRSFHVNKSGELVCRHRDVSCCDECARENREVLDVYGEHYWMPTEQEYAEVASRMGESAMKRGVEAHADVEKTVIASHPPKRPQAEITERGLHLLREIADGRDRVFASDDKPPGFAALMQCGYATRVGTERAAITPTGRAFLAGVDHASGRS